MTSIHIEITTSEPTRAPSRRHVQIPQSDQVTHDWFDIQKDQSASVRMLIRDEIHRHGMVDRIARQKFGTPAAQAAARAAQSPTVPAAAAASVIQAGSAFTGPTTPTPWSVPLLDPRDTEISELKAQLAERDVELQQLRDAVGPFSALIEELHREGLAKNIVV